MFLWRGWWRWGLWGRFRDDFFFFFFVEGICDDALYDVEH